MIQITTAHRTENRERGRSVHPGGKAQIARQIANVAFDFLALLPAIQSEHSRGPCRRPEEPQHHTDGRRLTGPVWPEEAEQHPFRDRERQLFDTSAPAVSAREVLELDKGHDRGISRVKL